MLSQYNLGRLLKGLYAAAIAALGIISTILVGKEPLSQLTDGQWVAVALFSLTAFGGAFGLAGWVGPTINVPPPGSPPQGRRRTDR